MYTNFASMAQSEMRTESCIEVRPSASEKTMSLKSLMLVAVAVRIRDGFSVVHCVTADMAPLHFFLKYKMCRS